MNIDTAILIGFYGCLGLFFSIKGFLECSQKGNAHKETVFLFPLGIFVWGDAVIFGFFWFLASAISILLHDVILFLLILSSFWFIRSLGETFYWFNQQFSKVIRFPPHTLRHYKYFKNDSIWFVYQISWQCVSVATLITTIYLSVLWINKLF